MTVRELIELLKHASPEGKVWVGDEINEYELDITRIRVSRDVMISSEPMREHGVDEGAV